MSGRLTDKVCLVTGAAQGIGRAIALAFLREGAEVVAVDRQEGALRRLLEVGPARLEAVDVTDPAAVAALARRHAAVGVLVNCVGVVPIGTALDCSPDELEGAFRINVTSMLSTIRAFLPAMRARRAGSIVNIASVVSSVKAAPGRCAYATTKAAVIGLTKSVAADFIGEGIRCNAISPGTVESPSLAERMAALGDAAAARTAFVARQPMGRLGAPAEIAEVAVLLASEEAAFMTGENIVIDGGMSL